uniref:Putative HNH homing endonuclease n=1 Tax=Phacotus lenticularis TaxID=52965 RepID=A0A0S2LQT9_9CHLO|nr:putative HNH homing endonuclease [Phacotus lenticularis]ALO63638.1 putative HNH homing endonuclease [Phacotus lenticularis]
MAIQKLNVLTYFQQNPKASLFQIATVFALTMRDLRVIMGEEWCNEVATKNISFLVPKHKKYGVSAKQQKDIRIINDYRFPNNNGTIKCQCCNLVSWKKMGLICFGQIDHINGSTNNNDLSNLRILCPNCHSQTVTHSRKLIQETTEHASVANLLPAGKQEPTQAQLTTIACPMEAGTTSIKHSLEKIITNQVAFPRTARLVKRLLASGLKKTKCEGCGISSWRKLPIIHYLHGHHMDGNINNNSLDNLKLLCPNCHVVEHRLPLFVVDEPNVEEPNKLSTPVLTSSIEKAKNQNVETVSPTQHLSLNNVKILTTSTQTVTAVHGYDPNSPRAISIKNILLNPNRPIAMTQCAQELGIPFTTFKRMARSLYPDLWVPDPGSSRRCDERLPEIQKQIKQIQEALVINHNIRAHACNYCITYHRMGRKRFDILYKRYILSPSK